MAEELLRVENLKMYFRSKGKDVKAVDDVSFTINKAETFGLVGESGSGKSATCKALLGLNSENAHTCGGRILFEGKELLQLPEKELNKIRGKEIGMIFQEPMTALNPVLKIKDQIFEAFPKGTSKKEMLEASLEMFHLIGIPEPERRINEYIHQFSGGMRQRAMIAIALIAQPKLLIADEPTTALDVTIQDQIIRLLNRIRKELGMSMILITHDLGVVSRTCDRIAVMYAGNIVEMAEKKTLLSKPGHPYTSGLIRSLPGRGGNGTKLYSIPGAPPDLSERKKECAFADRCRFTEAKCRTGLPPMREITPGHQIRCIRDRITDNASRS